jgi:hypothetical protein
MVGLVEVSRRSVLRIGRRVARQTSVAAVAILVFALVTSCVAEAETGHPFISEITTAGAASALEEPRAVAVDRTSGDLFVADPSSEVVDVYNASGSFLTSFGEEILATGVAVDESTGLVFVSDSTENAVGVFKADGKGGYAEIGEWAGKALPGGGFGEVTGVAVDNSGGPSAGDVYVVDGEDPTLSAGVVDVFRPQPLGPEAGAEGELVRVLSKGAMEEPNAVAVDSSSGRVYVGDSVKGAIYEYSDIGVLEAKLNGASSPQGRFGKEEAEENISAVAVDPTSADLLVAEPEQGLVNEFDSSGAWVGSVPSTASAALIEPAGIGLDATGGLYVSDGTLGRVDVYGPAVVVPDAATEKATKLTRTSAQLSGTLNSNGLAAQYFFQWGTTSALGSSTPPVPFSGAQQTAISTLGELTAGSTYFFRIVAENANGQSYGVTKQFVTPPAVDKLSTGPVAAVLPEAATLTGSLAPNGFDTHYVFEFGGTTSYGNSSPGPPGIDAGAAKGTAPAETALTGLTPNTTYHYRLVASNSFGTTFGADQQFTTSGPPRITTKPATGIGHETATINAEVNPDQLETTYRFEYGQTTEYGTETPLGGKGIGKGATAVPVSAALTGLEVGVTYHYRVTATNSAGTRVTPDRTFTTVPPALITSYANHVSPTEVTLNAEVNPLGNDTKYYFEYGTEPCAADPGSCTASPAVPGEDIGAGAEPVVKTLPLSDLEPNTAYHYRVVAANALGIAEGSEHTVTTSKPLSTFALPDGRAWEMVTPPDKEGAPIESLTREGGIILAADDGNALTYVADGTIGEAEGNRTPEMQQFLASRGSERWTNRDLATPSTQAKGITAGQSPEYQYFSEDLRGALDEPPSRAGAPEPPLAPGVTQATPYIRDNTANVFTPLITNSNTAEGTVFGGSVHFLDATPDLSSVVMSSSVPLLGPGSAHGLYEWANGELSFVSTLPGGGSATTPELGFQSRVMDNAISADGSRVAWTNREDSSNRGGHLYLHDSTSGQTVQLDAARGAAEPNKGSAQFQAASSDGSRVFFTDKQRLTADSTAEPGQGVGKPDLYECAIVEAAGKLACQLRDLTVDQNEGDHAFVQNLIFGTGESGSTVYLIAQGILASNENGNHEAAQPGAPNLYVLQNTGPQWSTTFVATLSSEDNPEWEGNKVGNPAFLTARVSPSGRYVAFMSAASLTGYDNVDANPAAKGGRDEEVFLYDADTLTTTCVSCNPTGARPAGVLDRTESGEGLGLLVDRRKVWAEGHEHWLGGNIPGWTSQTITSALFQSRYLDDEGRLFFNSPDDLVPAASNHKEDVYEYEPDGVGTCESATGGCLALISSGSSDRESAFLEATGDGSSAFFLTEANLLPQDTDTAFDIYDARTCTGASPCLTDPAPPAEGCSKTETCRPAGPPVTMSGGATGTAAFSGPGNQPAPSAHRQVLGTATRKLATGLLTRAQRLAKALQLCRRTHSHSKAKRQACERLAHKRYAPKKRAKSALHGKAPLSPGNHRSGR